MALRLGPKPSGATLPILWPRFVTGPESCTQRGRSGPWELQLYKAVRQLGQALGWEVGAEGCWERRGSEGGPGRGQARGFHPSAPPPHDTKRPLSSLQAAGKGSVRWLPYIPWFCLQGKHTCSVAFLSVLVSAEPKNIARGTMRICPQSSGLALVPTCFASSRATFRHSGEKIEKIEKQLSGGDC